MRPIALMPGCVTRTLVRAGARFVALALSALAGPAGAQMSSTMPASAAAPTPAGGDSLAGFNVTQLFANTCGWCHASAGRVAGRGPQLMGTTLTDSELTYRIKTGKAGAMPAFGTAFTEDQIKAIVKYIRDLKPERP